MTKNKMAPKPIANPDLPKPPSGKYPGKAHARRVAQWIAENGGPSSGVIYLEGQSTKMVEDDDQASHHRQRRHFFYLTGCDLPDCFFAYDIASDRSTLWIPPVDPEYVMWAGMPLLPDEAKERYDVDDVLTSDELKTGASLLRMLEKQNTVVFVIEDRADLAVFHSEAVQKTAPRIDHAWARKAIEECRVVKDEHEIALIRHANIVSSYAHEQVLRAVTRARNERELHAVFVLHCHANACKEQAYGCICAAGSAGSTLHYVHNDQPLVGKDTLLLDAGCEYSCYCADITRTFPLTPDGRFTPEARAIYELVLRMQAACMRMIRAGVRWEDVHMRAHAVAADGLRALGILRPHLTTDRILASRVTTRFFPHGLGHYLGLDTHDTGGHAVAPADEPDPFFAFLRKRGPLPAGAVITNEPGIYFREFPLRRELDEGKWDGIVDQEVLARFWRVGGVRIEDDVVVREDGCENLTTVPSDWQAVEEMVVQGSNEA